MATLKLPTPLRPYANGGSSFDLAGNTVEDVLQKLMNLHPELKKHLYNEEDQLRPYVNLFLGEDNVNQLKGLKTPVQDSDTLLIIPSIAGG
jgi:adenylyltransferase/sulfurtransferase